MGVLAVSVTATGAADNYHNIVSQSSSLLLYPLLTVTDNKMLQPIRQTERPTTPIFNVRDLTGKMGLRLCSSVCFGVLVLEFSCATA